MTIAVHSRWLATSTLFEHARPLIIPVERLSKHSDGLGSGFHHRGEVRVIDTYPNRYTRSYSLRVPKINQMGAVSMFFVKTDSPNLGAHSAFFR